MKWFNFLKNALRRDSNNKGDEAKASDASQKFSSAAWPSESPSESGAGLAGVAKVEPVGFTQENADQLQRAVDDIFEKQGPASDLGRLRFSFTIADPLIDGCPLIGCSTGFGALCGYTFKDIVGRNCRFLVDPVPPHQINHAARRIAKEFCEAVANGEDYRVPADLKQPWMDDSNPGDSEQGVFLAQTNSKKDGTLFKNVFYLKPLELDDHPYIVGLQTEVQMDDAAEMAAAHRACKILDRNMTKLETMLAGKFWLNVAMRRQEALGPDDGYEEMTVESVADAKVPGCMPEKAQAA